MITGPIYGLFIDIRWSIAAPFKGFSIRRRYWKILINQKASQDAKSRLFADTAKFQTMAIDVIQSDCLFPTNVHNWDSGHLVRYLFIDVVDKSWTE